MFQTQRTNITFQEDYLEIWVDTFLKERGSRHLSKRSVGFYREKLIPFTRFCETQAVKQVSQITPSLIREFLLFLESKGNNPGGIATFYRSIKAFLRWYWEETEPDYPNPIDKVKAPRVPEKLLEPVSYQDVLAMMDTCHNDLIGRRDRAMMLFLLDSGVRASELLGIQLSEVDIVSGQVFIRKTKGSVPRNIYLGENSLRSLRRYLKLRRDTCTALWITSDAHPLGYWGLREVMTRRAEIAHVPPPPLHSFRRWFAISFLRNGGSVFALQKAGGWKSLAAMRPYIKFNDSDIETAMREHSPIDNLR